MAKITLFCFSCMITHLEKRALSEQKADTGNKIFIVNLLQI